MDRKGWTRIIAIIVGAIIGAVIGYYYSGQFVGGAVVGAVIGAVGLGLIVLIPGEGWLALAELGQIVECCSVFGVLLLASLVTLGGLLFWHSFALAALAGVSVMTMLLMVLSAWVHSYKPAQT